jgi:peptide/nickel transport system substrate-binding protein
MAGTRHTRRPRTALFAALVAILALLIAHVGLAAQHDDRFGGVIRAAIVYEPSVLDLQFTTDALTTVVAGHWMETPLAFDANYNIQPLLVREWSISEDGTIFDLRVAEGITFHNGQPMTAEDVAASIERWNRVSVRGRAAPIASVEATGPHDVRITLETPFAPLLPLLAHPNAAAGIYPREIIERYPDRAIEEHIGTGPFRFVEYLPDRHIRLERFEDYTSLGDGLNLWAGSKVPYADEVLLIPVSEVAAREAGLRAGDYDVAMRVSTDAYRTLLDDPNTVPALVHPAGFIMHNYNKRTVSTELRRAIHAAMDMEEQLIAAYGDPEFWALNHNVLPGNPAWATEIGRDQYNVGDPELARQLAEEAGYDGRPIRWITRPGNADHFAATQVAVEQVRAAGINVEIIALESATFFEYRANPDLWDINTTGHDFSSDPVLANYLTDTWDGWWESPRREELVTRLHATVDLEQRMQVWQEVVELYYEEIPTSIIGQFLFVEGISADLRDHQDAGYFMIVWDAWLER